MRVHGTVQGVGFRPYVYRLRGELALDGFVLNDSHGVLLEVEGSAAAVGRFLARLPATRRRWHCSSASRPKSASRPARPDSRSSRAHAAAPPNAPVTPDSATCEQCLRELFDPGDRRFRYPFINCTNCGPRFTIVRGVPYDRPATTMAAFAMCARCQAEYDDPRDRRFHAQPNACPHCGPARALRDGAGDVAGGRRRRDPVQAAARALRDGAIVAVKGIGGFHLACRADDEARGRRAARAQASRGQAVRADGRARRGGASRS